MDKTTLGWIHGSWGPINTLSIPINSRGLNLGDGLFETILILNNKPQLLNEHLQRLHRSAQLLSMFPPPKEECLKKIIEEGIEKAKLNNGCGALRINWSRGIFKDRTINITKENNNERSHYLWLTINQMKPTFNAITTSISRSEKRNAESKIIQCKTLGYMQSILARHEAQQAGFNDALLLSTTGEICCGTTSNILIKRDNEFITPRLASGCLPGVMRGQGIKAGKIKERVIKTPPQHGDNWFLINSLSCHPIRKINTTVLDVVEDGVILWESLFNK